MTLVVQRQLPEVFQNKLKRHANTQVLPLNFRKILGTPILKNICQRLLLVVEEKNKTTWKKRRQWIRKKKTIKFLAEIRIIMQWLASGFPPIDYCHICIYLHIFWPVSRFLKGIIYSSRAYLKNQDFKNTLNYVMETNTWTKNFKHDSK